MGVDAPGEKEEEEEEESVKGWRLRHKIVWCRRGCRRSSHVSPGALQRAPSKSFFSNELSSLRLLFFFPRRVCRRSSRVSPGAVIEWPW